MSKISLRIICFALLFIILFRGCTTKNKLDIDVSNIKVEVKIQRFEKDLFSIKPDSISAAVTMLASKYGNFFDLYNNKIITIGSSNHRSYPDYLKGFLTDFTINEVYKKCIDVFPDVNDIETRLTDAFRHYKYYFPNKTIPQVYTYISGFNQSIVTDEKILGIGLDKYLGKNCDFYKRLTMPVFTRNKLYKERIPSDCMTAIAYSEFPYESESENLINQIVYQGKVMYFLDAMLPIETDSVKFGFSDTQVKWCIANEKEMWLYLIDKKQLFVTDFIAIKKYMDEGPFTPNFSKKSPAKACIWLGREIIRAYMDKNPKITLKQLMKDKDYPGIFAKAKYKP